MWQLLVVPRFPSFNGRLESCEALRRLTAWAGSLAGRLSPPENYHLKSAAEVVLQSWLPEREELGRIGTASPAMTGVSKVLHVTQYFLLVTMYCSIASSF